MSELALRKTLEVSAPPERAFLLFTDGMSTWWPLRTHSVGEERAETVVFEPGVGGRILERTRDGEEHLWGTVTVWEPPFRVAFTWHPGRTAETEQDVEVTFQPSGGGTRLELVHTGWERLGEGAAARYASYDRGWEPTFERFRAAADA